MGSFSTPVPPVRHEREIPAVHKKSRKAQVVSGLLLAAAAAATAPASPAGAAAGPAFTYASCGDTSFLVTCTFTWSGGTSPYTATWTAIEGPMSPSGGSGSFTGNTAYAGGNCVPQNFYEVKMTVTDAAGLSATTYAGGRCN
jgi:hypothetical protein